MLISYPYTVKTYWSFFFRHEPPVVGNPLEIIELTDELVVLNKPSSIPVGWNLMVITKLPEYYITII